MALERVRHRLAVGTEGVAPDIRLLREATAGGILPLRLGGKPLPRPTGVGQRVLPADLHDGMVLATGNAAAGTLWMAPTRAGDVAPPAGDVIERHGVLGWGEYERAGDQFLRRHAGELLR